MISAKLNQGKNILWALRRTKICPLSYKIPLLLLSFVADELKIYRNCYKTAVYKPYAHLISIHFLFFFYPIRTKKSLEWRAQQMMQDSTCYHVIQSLARQPTRVPVGAVSATIHQASWNATYTSGSVRWKRNSAMFGMTFWFLLLLVKICAG